MKKFLMSFLTDLIDSFRRVVGNEGGYFWIPMAIGAGVGLLKNQEEQAQVRAQNKAAAAQTEYSALTGMGPGQIQQAPSAWEGMMQGAMAGAQFGMAGQSAGLWGQGAGAGASQGAQMAGTQGSQIRNNPWKSMGNSMYA